MRGENDIQEFRKNGEEDTWLSINCCWAKTYPKGHPQEGKPALNVTDHCFTVGYVAEEIIAQLPSGLARIFPEGAAVLIAAHDIGKLTPGFQIKCLEWEFFEPLNQLINHNGLCTNHANVSQWHLQSEIDRIARRWLTSTGGHHGSYPFGNPRQITQPSEGGCQQFIGLRDQLLQHLTSVFGSLPTESAKNQEKRIHLLTGLTIFADWIGSNTDWFPLDTPVDAKIIRAKTREIFNNLGRSVSLLPERTFGQQFQPTDAEMFRPRAIQRELLEAADAPGLYILEAPMGLGKTEAALSVAYQLCKNGINNGLYFALPTQLTSNKIHHRITSFLENTIGKETVQSLVHGNAWLKEDKNLRLAPRNGGIDSEYPERESNDTEEALRWYSSTRKALLAPFGTGTIDQALLAVLPARFAALRYFALAGKVVVIDEVHSYDPYMSSLIDRLIAHLTSAGSTVIILSATLTAKRRKQLVHAMGATEPSPPTAYPLITKVSSGSTTATHHPSSEKLPSKTIYLVHNTLTDDSESAYWQSIADLAEGGANIVIIRNTVALAQSTYRQIKSALTARISDANVGIIHSRFPQWQREKNENSWTDRLGKSDATRPQGCVLVSTQILEQSVDIDADLLVTDLAPVDLILQRIGRLHRHERSRPANCRQPRCHILHPKTNWQSRVKEIKEQLAPHHFIYPPLALWQASSYLKAKDILDLPTQIREILENASAARPAPGSSPALEEFELDYKKLESDQTGTANTRGIFSASAIEDLEGAETRYKIQPSTHIILLRRVPNIRRGEITLHPFCPNPEEQLESYTIYKDQFSFPLAKALHLNAARVSSYLVKDNLPFAPDWLKNHIDSAILAVVSDSGTELQLYPDEPNSYTLHYHPIYGITHEKNSNSDPDFEAEDDWY